MALCGLAVVATATMSTTTALAGGQAGAKVTVEQHETAMKTIATANGVLGKSLAADPAAAAKEAATIAAAFGEVERFWTQYNKADAVTWSQQAKQAATGLAAAITAKDDAKVQELRKSLTSNCGACHTAYREGGPQTGGYTLKAGIVTP
jgi:hypothetical protein